MFNLTRQEKSVLLFIALVVLVGIGINYLQKRNLPFKEFIAVSPTQTKANLEVNLNRASSEELVRLPGIGPELARRIIDYRKDFGAFKIIEDIQKVKGIGKGKFKRLKDYIVISEKSK